MKAIVREQVPLHQYTTLRVGGQARYFVEVNNLEELEKAVRFAKQTALPFLILGGGSNLLISDQGYNGVVIFNCLKGINYIENEDDSVTMICQAGEMLDDVIADTVSRGYWGLENLSSIPGTVGATPVQNVGAYGVEVADLIVGVETYDTTNEQCRKLTNSECGFGYRDSFFKSDLGKKQIITAVHFRLNKKPNPKINYADLQKFFSANFFPTQSEIRNAIVNIRSEKFPNWKEVGTAGSFFKNPIIANEQSKTLLNRYPQLPVYKFDEANIKISLGYVLDKILNLKGFRRGEVGLFASQALVLVNYGNKNSEEIKKFSEWVIKKVYAETGIMISPEVNFVE